MNCSSAICPKYILINFFGGPKLPIIFSVKDFVHPELRKEYLPNGFKKTFLMGTSCHAAPDNFYFSYLVVGIFGPKSVNLV